MIQKQRRTKFFFITWCIVFNHWQQTAFDFFIKLAAACNVSCIIKMGWENCITTQAKKLMSIYQIKLRLNPIVNKLTNIEHHSYGDNCEVRRRVSNIRKHIRQPNFILVIWQPSCQLSGWNEIFFKFIYTALLRLRISQKLFEKFVLDNFLYYLIPRVQPMSSVCRRQWYS